MSLYDDIRGIIDNIFQLGKEGSNIKDNAGVVEFRNADDNDYVRAKAATPQDDNDLATKLYVDSANRAIIIADQVDTSTAIPNNSAVRRFLVVTTPGNGANVGDILFDDGSASGTMTILPAVEGRTIVITDSLTGGTVTFEPDSIYIWDADNTEWKKIGDIGGVTGAVRTIRYDIDNSADQDSSDDIPANARVQSVMLVIVTSTRS